MRQGKHCTVAHRTWPAIEPSISPCSCRGCGGLQREKTSRQHGQRHCHGGLVLNVHREPASTSNKRTATNNTHVMAQPSSRLKMEGLRNTSMLTRVYTWSSSSTSSMLPQHQQTRALATAHSRYAPRRHDGHGRQHQRVVVEQPRVHVTRQPVTIAQQRHVVGCTLLVAALDSGNGPPTTTTPTCHRLLLHNKLDLPDKHTRVVLVRSALNELLLGLKLSCLPRRSTHTHTLCQASASGGANPPASRNRP